MRRHNTVCTRPTLVAAVATLLVASTLVFLLAACGGQEATPEVIVVTETSTPGRRFEVVTATFTPTRPASATEEAQQASSTAPLPAASDASPARAATTTLIAATTTKAPVATQPPVPSVTTTTQPQPKPTSKPPALKSYFVVFTSFNGPDIQDYRLWGMDGAGGGLFEVEGAGRASEPAFSVAGDKFAFYHWTDGLYIWDLNSKTSTHILHNGEATFPTWAPDGKRLAYFDQTGQRWIYIINADGSGNAKLTPGMRPNWSQKGGFIAYDTCEDNNCGVFRINPDGGGKQQLTTDGGGGAAVSPNGKKIAYWSQSDGDFEIYVINANGSSPQQLTRNAGNDALPAWSPDGKYIYYLSDQDGKGWAVMVMAAGGADQRKVVGTSAGSDPVRGWQYQRITVTWQD